MQKTKPTLKFVSVIRFHHNQMHVKLVNRFQHPSICVESVICLVSVIPS